jgi:hypothetical protein
MIRIEVGSGCELPSANKRAYNDSIALKGAASEGAEPANVLGLVKPNSLRACQRGLDGSCARRLAGATWQRPARAFSPYGAGGHGQEFQRRS